MEAPLAIGIPRCCAYLEWITTVDPWKRQNPASEAIPRNHPLKRCQTCDIQTPHSTPGTLSIWEMMKVDAWLMTDWKLGISSQLCFLKIKGWRLQIASALSELLQQDPTRKSIPKPGLKHGSGHGVIDPSRPWPTVGSGISQNLSRRKRNAKEKKCSSVHWNCVSHCSQVLLSRLEMAAKVTKGLLDTWMNAVVLN